MVEKFFPDIYRESVFEIDYPALYARGIRALVFDVDNTLAPFDVKYPPAKIVRLFARLKKMGFQICLLSNNSGKRVSVFNNSLGVLVVSRAMKPFAGGLRKAMRELGSDANSTAMIGDQIFTDVYCGKRAHVLVILVKPIAARDEWTVRWKRFLERAVLKAMAEKGMLP